MYKKIKIKFLQLKKNKFLKTKQITQVIKNKRIVRSSLFRYLPIFT